LGLQNLDISDRSSHAGSNSSLEAASESGQSTSSGYQSSGNSGTRKLPSNFPSLGTVGEGEAFYIIVELSVVEIAISLRCKLLSSFSHTVHKHVYR
jgi:hypothetical protein